VQRVCKNRQVSSSTDEAEVLTLPFELHENKMDGEVPEKGLPE
jgi:hypothetical protein